jgi:transposase InsO family protein
MREHRTEFPLAMMCRLFEVSRSGYYAWLGRPESRRDRENRLLTERIRAVHAESRQRYGSPRVSRQLRAEGYPCGKNRVAKLMKENGIRAKRRRRYKATTDSKHVYPVAPNLLERRFEPGCADRVWASDITYIQTQEGWLYLAPMMDLHSRRIVGWSAGSGLDHSLVAKALEMAIANRRPQRGLIHHSDRGVQYACGEYQRLLRSHGMRSSMCRKGDCWDNAPMESFFASLKTELVRGRSYRTRAEARREIFEYIEVFYNRRRMHSSLGYLSPVQFEALATPKAP